MTEHEHPIALPSTRPRSLPDPVVGQRVAVASKTCATAVPAPGQPTRSNSSLHDGLLTLQRLYGNQMVMRMLAADRAAVGGDSTLNSLRPSSIQRKCPACAKRDVEAADTVLTSRQVDSNRASPRAQWQSVMPVSPIAIQRDPFDTVGPDNSTCRDKISEDGARCADHANTMCSVVGAGGGGSAAMVGAGIGSLIAPGAGTLIGGALGLLVGGIGGALAYGKCVERMNSACRIRTSNAMKACDKSFPVKVGALDAPAPTGADSSASDMPTGADSSASDSAAA